MNYLAHFLLSGEDENIILGNFMGDGIKGSQFKTYPQAIQNGVLLHRTIDDYTDHHPVVLSGVALLREHFRKYSPVVLDVFFDHFLARKWKDYHPMELQEFASAQYALLTARKNELPLNSQRFLHYMVQNNILVNYANMEGIEQVFSGMAYRARFDSGMENAAFVLEEKFSELEAIFVAFFPDLQNHVKNFLTETT